MAPDPKVIAAFQAMKALGISQVKVKPVLKNLLRLYEKNWSLIEEDNYRALADAIFDAEEIATEEKKKRKNGFNEKDLLEEEEEPGPEPERPLKRLRLRGREVNQSPELSNSRLEGSQVSPQNVMRNKGKEPMVAEKSLVPFSPNHGVRLKEPMDDSGRIVPRDSVTATVHMLIEPKDEPYTDDTYVNDVPQYEVPIAVIHQDPLSKEKQSAVEKSKSRTAIDPMHERDIQMENGEMRAEIVKESAFQCDGERIVGGLSLETNSEEAPAKDGSTCDLNVATSASGEVKLFLSCNSAVGKRKFHMPTLDAVIKMTEEKCLRSFKITDPKFSVMKLLSGLCESFLELGTDTINEPQGLPNGTDHILSGLDNEQVCEKTLENALGGGSGEDQILNDDDVHTSKTTLDSTSSKDKVREPEDPKSANMWEIVSVPPSEWACDELRSLDNVKDITRGEEWVQIPWTNGKSYECPPAFRYISAGVVFQNAKLDISLSRIGATSCCPTCPGDCLSASVPCACAQETGGQFAYTTEGVVKEGFLEECISLTRDTQHQSLMFCEECPLERSKTEDCSEPCKGHLKRKFIKECWTKCGCSKKCGNRVVQRGITRNLQVFFTADERGWGLRTLEELPKGTFVCEYVGEILTTTESREREMKCDKSSKDTYLALLDADWGSKETLSDDKALCLDASQFGNVSRFINHRCLDANLVEIPVEVETPDHHYYHVAFFTTRKVDALEELTWDYGIDFDDFDHPIKPFLCRCGSKFCRNIKRQNRSKSTPMAS